MNVTETTQACFYSFSFERSTLKSFIENWIQKQNVKQTENTALNEFFNKFNCLFITKEHDRSWKLVRPLTQVKIRLSE
jgi:hypothetical protein